MNQQGCGCGGDSPNDEYLMVKATGKNPSTCGLPDSSGATTGTVSCPKQEPEFDNTLSDFVVPATGASVSIQVCNPSVYSVDQWIQFPNGLTMQVISITGNNLQIRNSCPNGSPIIDNPTAGLVISRNTRFFTVGKPPCQTEEQRLDEILEALSGASEICVPDLVESSNQAHVQPVGRVEADPSDTSFKKCLRRIYGILFKAGTPILSAIQKVSEANIGNYRKLGIDKANREVWEIPDFSEFTGLTSGQQYQTAFKPNGTEYIIGPDYGFKPVNITLLEIPTNPLSGTFATSPASATILNQTFNLSSQTDISSIKRNQDHYYVLAHLEVGYTQAIQGVKILAARLNGSLVCTSVDLYGRNTLTIPIRVENSNNELTLLIEQSVASVSNYIVRLYIRGVWY